MKMTNKLFATAIVAATASFSASANASVFVADYAPEGVWNAYDSNNETYSARFRSDQGNDGFWLVVSAGDNPRGNGSDYAILYGDLETNRITAYSYDGTGGNGSFNTGTLLGTFDGAFESGGTHARHGYETTQFTIDVAGINGALGPDFEGVQLGDESGIWFHQTQGSDFTYGADGSITDYAFASQTFLDRGNTATRHRDRTKVCSSRPDHYYCQASTSNTGGSSSGGGASSGGGTSSSGGGTSSGGGSVPAPGGLALVLLGLAGLGRKLRKQA